MDSAKINEWVQIVGIFALVASLLFVGLQLKQAQDIALSEVSQSRTDTTVELIVNSAENPYFVSAFAKIQNGDRESMTSEEHVAMRQYATALLYLYENQQFQYSSGFITEERWQAAKRTMTNFLSDDSPFPMRESYETYPFRFSNEFQEVVDNQISDIDSNQRPE